MKQYLHKLVYALLAFPMMAPGAYAWGYFGHRTIGYIAEARLTPAAQAAVARILGPGVSLADVAPWADSYRAEAPQTARWHYLNFPIHGPASPELYAHYCPEHACLVDQINADLRTLQDAHASLYMQNMALKFLVHLVGDLHQPLHCADDQDAGGNDKQVVFQDTDGNPVHTSLHHLWDRLVGVDVRGGPTALAERLNQTITPNEVAAWDSGTPAEWAYASYRIAKNTIYPGFAPGRTPAPVTLPAGYAAQMDPIVEQQLEKAGVRLAWLLNNVYGP